MGGFSWWHWVIILSVFVLLFGAKKLPDAARGVGRSLRILKSEVSAMHDDEEAKKAQTGETDASASVATPTAQIVGAPAVAPQYPTASVAPVVNGLPVVNASVTSPVSNAVPVSTTVPVDEQRS